MGGGEGGRGRVGGVRVDVIEELKFLGKFTKKKNWGGGSGGDRGGGVGSWGGVGLGGWVGGGGQGGCERRIEVFHKIHKKNRGGGGREGRGRVGGGSGWWGGGQGGCERNVWGRG